MLREIVIGGALVPGLLVLFVGCLLAQWAISNVVGRLGWYRYVWHPPLFRIALFGWLFGAAGLLLFP